MIKNILQFIYNLDGSLIDKNLTSVRAHSNYMNVIQIIAPWPASDSISVEYTLYNSGMKKLQDHSKLARNASGEALLGKDVIPTGKAYFQTVKEWYVWEIEVGKKALAAISKNYAGKIWYIFNSKRKPNYIISNKW